MTNTAPVTLPSTADQQPPATLTEPSRTENSPKSRTEPDRQQTITATAELFDEIPGIQGVVREIPEFASPPTFQQWHGMRLATSVLIFICSLIVIFLSGWCWTRPTIADVQALYGANVTGKELLDALQSLRVEHFNNFRDLFQLLVLSVLMPLFTLLAGYAFGSRQAEKEGK